MRSLPAPAHSDAVPDTRKSPAMRKTLLASALVVTAPFLSACTENAPSAEAGDADPRAITVTSSDDACEVSADSAPAGTLT